MDLNIGVIGQGVWGTLLTNKFSMLGCGVLTNDTRCKKSNMTGQKEQLDEMFSEIEAVAIATPNDTHYSLTKQALERGKHVWVEKPLAIGYHQCRELLKMAEARDLVLAVGHQMIYHRAIGFIKAYLKNSGDVRRVMSKRYNFGRDQKVSSALWNLAPHNISIILEILNYAWTGRCINNKNHGFVFMVGPRAKEYGVVEVCWDFPAPVAETMFVFESPDGPSTLIFDEIRNDVSVFSQKELVIRSEFGDQDILKIACTDFIESIEKGKYPKIDVRHQISVYKILTPFDPRGDMERDFLRGDTL